MWVDIISFLEQYMDLLYLLVFAVFLGFELIAKVPTVLHTPLMSGSNAISGIVVLGAILLLRTTEPTNYFNIVISCLGIIFGTINIVGGFSVTQRMLMMFKKRKS